MQASRLQIIVKRHLHLFTGMQLKYPAPYIPYIVGMEEQPSAIVNSYPQVAVNEVLNTIAPNITFSTGLFAGAL